MPPNFKRRKRLLRDIKKVATLGSALNLGRKREFQNDIVRKSRICPRFPTSTLHSKRYRHLVPGIPTARLLNQIKIELINS